MHKTRVYLAGTSVLEGTVFEEILTNAASCEVVGRLQLEVGESAALGSARLELMADDILRLRPNVVIIGVKDVTALHALRTLLSARLVFLSVRDARVMACAFEPDTGEITEVSAEQLAALATGDTTTDSPA